MIISIERVKSYSPENAPEVVVTYKVPTAEDFEQIIREKPGDCEVFNEFVISLEGLTDSDGKVIDPKEVTKTPGTWSLVTGVAKAIIEAATLGPDAKNA